MEAFFVHLIFVDGFAFGRILFMFSVLLPLVSLKGFLKNSIKGAQ